jgi:hypothetical protein
MEGSARSLHVVSSNYRWKFTGHTGDHIKRPRHQPKLKGEKKANAIGPALLSMNENWRSILPLDSCNCYCLRFFFFFFFFFFALDKR